MDQGLDWNLDQAINGLAGSNAILDRIAVFTASDLIFLIVLGAVVWWFLPLARDAGKRAAIAAAAAVVGGLVLSVVVEHVLFVPRPFVAHQVHLLVSHAPDASFPSDHATVAFAVAGTAMVRRMPGRWLLLIAAALVAVARVFVGLHYPADVIGGAVIGSAGAVALIWLDPWLALPSSLAIGLARRFHVG